MEERKNFLLRINPGLWRELESWAQEELRSVNGQIEYLLKQAVEQRKKSARRAGESSAEERSRSDRMKSKLQFGAPWDGKLRFMSLLGGGTCLATMVLGSLMAHTSLPARMATTVIPLAILSGCALFIVRGYRLEDHFLLIQRLLWQTRVDLYELKSAVADPVAMQGSIKLCGNGGFFSISGWFRNGKLGNYRAFATDAGRSVVLRFPSRVVVVTPENPEQFADAVRKLRGLKSVE